MASDRLVPQEFSYLLTDAVTAAKRLLGCIIEREFDGVIVRVKIVETEAYDQSDAASHSFNSRTPRTKTMFGPAGRAYVYFTYGMHYCCNVVVGETGYGAAVLIRAVEPLNNIDELKKRRPGRTILELTNGPAKLCQALGINLDLNGHKLSHAPFRLIEAPAVPDTAITITTRIGITKAKDAPWRFYVTDSPYVSKRVRDGK